jgi:hypothetical protein
VCVTIDEVGIGEWVYWPLNTHRSELQVTTVLSLISSRCKSQAHAKSSPACSVSISCSHTAASNSGDSSASPAQVLSSQPRVQNSTGLTDPELDCRFSIKWVRARVTLRLAVYRQSVRLGPKPLETHDLHFFFNWTLAVIVTSSLKRGWVYRLQLLLVLASAIILRFESRRTNDQFYCLRFEVPPTWRASSPYLYPLGRG